MFIFKVATLNTLRCLPSTITSSKKCRFRKKHTRFKGLHDEISAAEVFDHLPPAEKGVRQVLLLRMLVLAKWSRRFGRRFRFAGGQYRPLMPRAQASKFFVH